MVAALKHLTMTASNYRSAWKLLDTLYTNERELFKDHMNVFSSIPFVSSEDPVALRLLLNVTREFRQTLGEFPIEVEHCDPMVVFFVTQKLPSETAELWETRLGASTKIPAFQKLESFLDTRIESLEAIQERLKQSIIPSPISNPLKSRPIAKATIANPSQKK